MEFLNDAPVPVILLFLLSIILFFSYIGYKFERFNYNKFVSAIKEITPEERKIIKDFLKDIGIVKDESR